MKVANIFLIIVGIILIFGIIGGMASNVIDASDSVVNSNNCSDGTNSAGAEFVLNSTDGFCYNATTGANNSRYTALTYDLPLEGLFNSNGVILLAMMGFIALGVVMVVIKKWKQ